MKLRALTAFAMLLLMSGAILAEPPLDSTGAILEEIGERVNAGPKGVGIVVGLVDSSGSEYISCGVTDLEHARPVDENTVFDIGSVTKVFTATVLSDMAGRGEVSLDDAVAKYVPKRLMASAKNGREVKLIDLVTHTADLPRIPTNMIPLVLLNADNPYADYTNRNLYDFLSAYVPSGDVGVRYSYSNLGMGLLGHILTLKAGTDYETLIRTRILRPLGMNSTCISIPKDFESRLAVGHDANGRPLETWRMGALEGAGAVRSTAADMTRFLSANMRLMSSELYPAMARTHAPRFDTDIPNVKVAMGWHVLAASGRQIIWHNGATMGQHAFVGFDPEAKVGVVVLANWAEDIDATGLRILIDWPRAARSKAGQ